MLYLVGFPVPHHTQSSCVAISFCPYSSYITLVMIPLCGPCTGFLLCLEHYSIYYLFAYLTLGTSLMVLQGYFQFSAQAIMWIRDGAPKFQHARYAF